MNMRWVWPSALPSKELLWKINLGAYLGAFIPSAPKNEPPQEKGQSFQLDFPVRLEVAALATRRKK
jgi:hypothetical protein